MVESVKAFAWAAKDPSGLLSPFHFYRRPAGDRDVQFKILYCGICYSDLHTIKNHWGLTRYPLVPGHEITGVVTQVGPNVTKVKVGDNVGVGCFVDSCRKCDRCTNDLENYCPKPVTTYNSVLPDGTVTQGGYSDVMVVDEHFIIRWPENFPMDKGAPLLCAGITTYSPLRHYGLDKPGQRIGVVGLGGLGHMAVKFAKAFGAEVTIISTSADKRKEAVESLGVDTFVVSSDAAEMQAAAGTLDGIIDTVSAAHPLEPVLRLLKHDGTMVLVGLPTKPLQFMVFPLVMSRRKIGGSMIGGIKETQEMIDFAAKHNIVANVEMISIDYVNDAIERLEKGHVKYRFVIDIEKTLKPVMNKQ